MLIALLAVLGVDLIVLAFAVAVLLSRRAWVSRQRGAFKGMIRVVDGEVPGLRRKWKRGVGRWVGDVLVWAKAPLLFWNEFVQADLVGAVPREAGPADKVKRLGRGPVIVTIAASGARVEIATAAGHRGRALGAFAEATGKHATPSRTPTPLPNPGTDRTGLAILFHPWRVMAVRPGGQMLKMRPAHAAVTCQIMASPAKESECRIRC